MEAFARQTLALLLVAVGASAECSCHCEAICAQLIAEQRNEIAQLRDKVRALSQQAAGEPQATVTGAPTPRRTLACDEEEFLELKSNLDVEALRGCSTVRSLTIHGDNVTSLAGLQSLETATQVTVTGGAGLPEESTLTSLAGLEHLQSVDAGLVIEMTNLASLSGFSRLQTAGSITIQQNKKLRSLDGLEQLTRVEGDLRIERNIRLQSLTGLQNLTSVRDLLYINANGKLVNLSGLRSLRTAGHIKVYEEERLRSLFGLESLQTAGRFEVSTNPSLESLYGVGNLTEVSELLSVSSNPKLLSLSGLDGLRAAGAVHFLMNNDLESLHGLGSLTRVAGRLYVGRNDNLISLEGLWSLQTVGDLLIDRQERLASLQGLESLTSVSGKLSLESVTALDSLSGLQHLQTAGHIRIYLCSVLASFHGLGNLTDVWGDFVIEYPFALRSFEGLESLRTVGSLRLVTVDCEVRTLVGLHSLTHAYRGVFVQHCGVFPVSGLGALVRAGELRLELGELRLEIGYCFAQCDASLSPIDFLGAPFGEGALIDAVHVDETSWPKCTTQHEYAAFVSAVGDMQRSFIPKQRCLSRKLIDTVTCTKGRPCHFSVANFSIDGQEESSWGSVFTSGLTTGCGTCPESHLQSKVTSGMSGALVDFGYRLREEEVGLRSICLCGPSTDLRGPVGQLLLRGPRPSEGYTICSRGQRCTVTLDGEELEPTDHVVLTSSSCVEGHSQPGYAASWAGTNAYVLDDLAMWYAAPPALYRVCWKAPCSPEESECLEGGYFDVGQVQLFGPHSVTYTRVLGQNLTAANIGLGVADGDRMRLMRTCGEADKDSMAVLEASSANSQFEFGELTEARVGAGEHHLCWCQEREVTCTEDRHFMANSGDVWVQCPAGKEPVEGTGRCEECPAGRQQLKDGLDPCSRCPAGQYSPGGEERCKACQPGEIAEVPGSSTCVACRGWESANAEATGCDADPPMLALLASFPLSVGALCAILVRTIQRHWSVVDVSLDEDHTVVTTLGSHGLYNFGRQWFPVTLRSTGHPGLDSPSQPLRARVRDAARLELFTWEGSSIDSRLDTSMGTLMIAFPHNLYHQGWLLPAVVYVPGLFILVVILGALVVTEDMAAEAFLAAAATALVCTAASIFMRLRPHATPLTRRLSEFQLKLNKDLIWRCEKGPDRAIAVGKLHELLDFFSELLRDRTAYWLASNVLVPLTKAEQVSYAELVGPGQVEWFVSHFWGTAFRHFCWALQKHAESVCNEGSWTQLHYWVCFCSNNQHKIELELGDGWQDSSFYVTLRSGHCKGTCMVLDDKALPLTRVWCIFELLQTVKLQRSTPSFQGLLLCTSGGVLNAGSGSVEVAMALAERVADMNLETAQASNQNDADMIRTQVVKEMGSFTALNRFVCYEVHDMLGHAQSNANQQFAAVLSHLEESMAEPAFLMV